MKPRTIAFTTILLLLSCFALCPMAQVEASGGFERPQPFHALLIPPPVNDRVIGTLEMLMRQQPPPVGDFQAMGHIRLLPPSPIIPYTFGEIVRYNGTVVMSIGEPDVRGNETFFDLDAVIPADVASEMTQTPTAFTVRIYNDAGIAAEGALQFGHVLVDIVPE